MSAYEDLLDKVTKMVREYDSEWDSVTDVAKDILALILRTLETVTPEMRKAWLDAPNYDQSISERAESDWLSMLHASPLEPPK